MDVENQIMRDLQVLDQMEADGLLWKPSRTAVLRAYVGHAVNIAKTWIKENRVTQYIRTALIKLDPFVTHPRVVKGATTFVSLETIGGAFTCVGTATLLIAAGNWPLAVGVVIMYCLTVSVRYVLARNAMLETHHG